MPPTPLPSPRLYSRLRSPIRPPQKWPTDGGMAGVGAAPEFHRRQGSAWQRRASPGAVLTRREVYHKNFPIPAAFRRTTKRALPGPAGAVGPRPPELEICARVKSEATAIRSSRGLGRPVCVNAFKTRDVDGGSIRGFHHGPRSMCRTLRGRTHDRTRPYAVRQSFLLRYSSRPHRIHG